ncbi:MAG: AMP-binding protein [Rhodoferax sp.]|nr:AMP-binding protein [Rhodoferax sp.]
MAIKRGMGKFVVGNILVTAALRFGEREAFYCSSTERRFNFRQVNERCNRLANGLSEMGLKKGDVVAFLTTNRVEIVETFFALAKTGLIGIPLNYRLAKPELLGLMRGLNTRALICEAGFADIAAEASQDLPALSHLVMIGADNLPLGASEKPAPQHYEKLLDSSDAGEPQVEIEEADPFYFNLTSGTTGMPKCYVLTQYNNATLMNMFHAFDLSQRDVILTVFPMFGRVGFAWAVAGMMYGIRHVIMNFDVVRSLKLIERERITISNLVPTMMAMILGNEELARHDLSSLRALVFAGAMLPATIREEIATKIKVPIYEYYGLQETGTLVVSTPDDRMRSPGSVGRAILHTEVRVVNDKGDVLAPGLIGEIVGRSPGSATAYHENPEKSNEIFRDGWVHTGDLGTLDEEGYLTIRGRKKDMIVTGGQNVYAADVEDVIMSCPEVLDCAVIGLPDELWGERVTAVVVPLPGAAVTPESIATHCRQQLAGFRVPKQVILQTQALPRTPTGKVQKFILVERHRPPA